jgi:hypothetical protein
MNNLAIGNMIIYDTDPEYSDPMPRLSESVGPGKILWPLFKALISTSHSFIATSFSGISHATLNNINIVCTADNSGPNPGFNYEQIKIGQSQCLHIMLNSNPLSIVQRRHFMDQVTLY